MILNLELWTGFTLKNPGVWSLDSKDKQLLLLTVFLSHGFNYDDHYSVYELFSWTF